MPTPGNQVPRQFLGWTREAFEQEIQTTEAAIHNLQETRLQLKEGLNETTLLMSILPEEVLSHIFKLRIDEDTYVDRRPIQFYLGAVCRAWRRIIWGQSSFWKKLPLNFGGTTSITPLRLKLVKEWIDRSGHQLIHLRLRNRRGVEPSELYDLLLTISARWETLRIRGGPFIRLQEILSQRNLIFPSLRELDLGWFFLDNGHWPFKSAPLRKVSLEAYEKDEYDIEWSNLRDVVLHFRIDDALFVLNAASSCIQNATLNPFMESRLDMPHDAPYILPCLTALTVSIETALSEEVPEVACVSYLLRCLALPALQYLYIESGTCLDGRDNYAPALISMIRRSRCRLKTLHFCLAPDSALTESFLIEILQEVPSLNNLLLNYSMATHTISDATIDFLNPSLTSTEASLPLPNLLSFGYIGRGSFSFQNVESMLLSRFRHAKESDLSRRVSQNQSPESRLTTTKIKQFNMGYHLDPSLTSEDSDSTDQLQNLVGNMYAKLGPLFEEEGSNFTFTISR